MPYHFLFVYFLFQDLRKACEIKTHTILKCIDRTTKMKRKRAKLYRGNVLFPMKNNNISICILGYPYISLYSYN